MATTFTLIASSTVGAGGASSIDFTSIPSTYTDLCVFASLRTTRANVWDYAVIKFNNSSANFTYRVLEGGDSTVVSNTGTTAFDASGANATSNTFSNNFLYIPNYAGSTNKSFTFDALNESNQTTACYQDLVAGLWSQTTAINQITLTGGSGNFVQYSSAYLYGVSKS